MRIDINSSSRLPPSFWRLGEGGQVDGRLRGGREADDPPLLLLSIEIVEGMDGRKGEEDVRSL